jgi:hypothetical protein
LACLIVEGLTLGKILIILCRLEELETLGKVQRVPEGQDRSEGAVDGIRSKSLGRGGERYLDECRLEEGLLLLKK